MSLHGSNETEASGPGRGWMDRLAHDLRGPLSPLQTAVFLLRDARVEPPEREELLDVVDRQSRRLGAMIDEIGDWVRAEQGRLIVRREDTELAVLLDGIGQPLVGGAPDIRYGPGTDPLELQGDTIRLGQLLRTVISVRLARDDTSAARIDIDVVAPGRVRVLRRIACQGDAVAKAEHLLDAPLPAPQDDGLGLRLLVARAIAEAHGGTLLAHALDSDTIALTVELPLAATSATAVSAC